MSSTELAEIVGLESEGDAGVSADGFRELHVDRSQLTELLRTQDLPLNELAKRLTTGAQKSIRLASEFLRHKP